MLISPIFDRHAGLLGSNCLKKLQRSRVLIAGLGGLGSTVAQLLVRTGIGTLHIVDHDTVEESNLNRQLLYTSKDIGKPKVEIAKKRLAEISAHTKVMPHKVKIDANFDMPDVDVIVDCLDSFSDRFILDEMAEEADIPLVHGGVARFHGQVTVIRYGLTQTLREIFEAVEDSGPVPVYPPLVVAVASIQASETVKLLCGMGTSLSNKLLIVDMLNNTFDVIDL